MRTTRSRSAKTVRRHSLVRSHDVRGRALLHGLPGVGVSTLAGQWYCEMKTDLSFRHPEIQVSSMAIDSGIEGHEELSADAVPITREDLEEALKRKRQIFLQEYRFHTIFDGVRIIGVPDLIEFRGRRCMLVLEWKFSGRPDPFIDRYVQAQLYGWLLQRNSYDVRGLVCAVCVIPHRPTRLGRASKLELVTELGLIDEIRLRWTVARSRLKQHPMTQKAPFTISTDGWVMHAFRYDERAAQKHLEWSLGYWLKQRDPISTRVAAKCRKCPFNAAGVCNKALDAPDKDFRVTRRKGVVSVRVPWS